MTVKVSVADPRPMDALVTGNARKVMGAAAVHPATGLVRLVVTVGRAVALPTCRYTHRVVQMVDALELPVRALHWRCQRT